MRKFHVSSLLATSTCPRCLTRRAGLVQTRDDVHLYWSVPCGHLVAARPSPNERFKDLTIEEIALCILLVDS